MRSVRGRFADEDSPLDRDLPDGKRRRHTTQRASSWPPSKGTVIKSHKGGSNLESRARRRKASIAANSAQSSDVSRVLASKEGHTTRAESAFGFGETVVTTIGERSGFQIGPGNTTSVTTSSEEGDGILVQSYRLTGRFASPTDSFGSDAKDAFGNNRQRKARQVERNTRISSDEHGDGEVISPFSELAREKELNRIFGARLWADSYGKAVEKPTTASVTSRDEAGKLEKIQARTGQQDDCDELGFSSSSREYQGSSVITDLCLSSSSHSVISGIRGRSYKKFRSKEHWCIKEVKETPSGSNFAANEILDGHEGVADELVSAGTDEKRESFVLQPRHADMGCSTSEDQHARASSPSDDVDPESSGDDGLRLQRKSPTFVLSSGRLSKEQEKELGVRPTTIDDEFDRYFAQLML